MGPSLGLREQVVSCGLVDAQRVATLEQEAAEKGCELEQLLVKKNVLTGGQVDAMRWRISPRLKRANRTQRCSSIVRHRC